MQTEPSDGEDTITSANRGNLTAEEERRVITLSVCKGALFIKIRQHWLHCLPLRHQHIFQHDRFHCGYAFTYSNELFWNSFQISQVNHQSLWVLPPGPHTLRVVQKFSLFCELLRNKSILKKRSEDEGADLHLHDSEREIFLWADFILNSLLETIVIIQIQTVCSNLYFSF